ncbi:hypothetical protein JNB11_00485 [Kocuria palustris]|nr:hypothetical protein [Kocuria palustris]
MLPEKSCRSPLTTGANEKKISGNIVKSKKKGTLSGVIFRKEHWVNGAYKKEPFTQPLKLRSEEVVAMKLRTGEAAPTVGSASYPVTTEQDEAWGSSVPLRGGDATY